MPGRVWPRLAIALALVAVAAFGTGVGEGDRSESRAIGTLRAITSAQQAYSEATGHYGSLECLAGTSCEAGVRGPFVDPGVARLQPVSGYRFAFHSGPRVESPGVPAGSMTRFAVVAMPVTEASRRRSFCADDSGTVYVVEAGVDATGGRCRDRSRPLGGELSRFGGSSAAKIEQMDDTKAVTQVATDIAAAIGRRDVDTLARLLAPGFQFRSPGQDGAGAGPFLDGIKGIPGEIVFVKLASLTVDVVGDGAVATGVQHAQVRMDGKLVDDRRPFVDWFVRHDGGWRLRLAVDLPPLPDAAQPPAAQ